MPEVGSRVGDLGSAGRAAACSAGALLCAIAVLGAGGPGGSTGRGVGARGGLSPSVLGVQSWGCC